MSLWISGLYTFAYRFIQIFSLVLTGLLFVGGFLSTCYSLNMETQVVLTSWDNPFFNLLGMGIFFCLLFLFCRFFLKTKNRLRLLTFLTLGWILFVGALLVLFSKTVPAADALSVYSAAEAFASGDTSVIHPAESYLSYYPQQIGLLAFFEVFIRIWKLFPVSLPAYHFIKCVYVVLACCIVLLQEKTIHLLWKNERADCLYLLLAGANLPLLLYTSFVYGEIPSLAALSAAFYLLAVLFSEAEQPSQETAGKLHLLKALGALLFLSLSVLVRKNSLIPVIAVLIICTLYGIRNQKGKLLLWCLCCALCALFVLPGTQKLYEHRSGSTLRTGVTASSYIAMGMQEASRGNGWYNGFNFETYQLSGMDTETANAISSQAIQERLAFFKAHPGYAADFYLKKELSQWADGTYASRQATLATYGGRTSFFESLYTGTGSYFLIAYCNAYQNVLYLGVLLFLLINLHKKADIFPLYLGLLCVIGGFLFHTLWEANSRYIFPYSILLLPYTAQGISELFSHIAKGKRFR